MKQTFLDDLMIVIDSVSSPGYGCPTHDLKKFILNLPGSHLVQEEILPKHIAIKGVIVLCDDNKKYFHLSDEEKEKMKIQFEFRIDGDKYPKTAEVYQTGKFQYTGSWAEVVEMIVDNMSPGDKLMSLGIRDTNFFSYN